MIEISEENQTKIQGFGEAGLPPKKPPCYVADY